ncbi:MAG: hypothetical protein IPO52_16075 [Gemmatimonadetes bacterium]|nr:hypothetical protein [Gemmatimonadota bacterium]
MRTRLAARGEALYVNLNYVSFGNSTAQQSAAEYAELILATFQHMQSQYGFVPNAVEVILEPDNNTIRTGTGIGGLIATTGARLAAAGFHPDFIAPSVMNMGNTLAYLNQIVAVPGALTYLTDVAYHRYAGVSDANLVGIKTRAAQLGLRTAMLEHIGSGVEDLYADLTLGNVSAWQQYTLAYPTNDNGAQYYYISGGRPVMGNLTHALRQYFRYVRSGAYRVSATSLSGSVRPVAFTNPGAGMAVVLHVDAPGTYTVGGMRVGTYGVGMASATGHAERRCPMSRRLPAARSAFPRPRVVSSRCIACLDPPGVVAERPRGARARVPGSLGAYSPMSVLDWPGSCSPHAAPLSPEGVDEPDPAPGASCQADELLLSRRG